MSRKTKDRALGKLRVPRRKRNSSAAAQTIRRRMSLNGKFGRARVSTRMHKEAGKEHKETESSFQRRSLSEIASKLSTKRINYIFFPLSRSSSLVCFSSFVRGERRRGRSAWRVAAMTLIRKVSNRETNSTLFPIWTHFARQKNFLIYETLSYSFKLQLHALAHSPPLLLFGIFN